MSPKVRGPKPINVWTEVRGRRGRVFCHASGTTRVIDAKTCLTPWGARWWSERRKRQAIKTITRAYYTVTPSSPF